MNFVEFISPYLISFGIFILTIATLAPLHEFTHWIIGKTLGFQGEIRWDHVYWPQKETEKMASSHRFMISIAPLILLLPLGVLALTIGLPNPVIAGVIYISTPSNSDIKFAFYNEFKDRPILLHKIGRLAEIVRVAVAVTGALML